MFRTRRLDQLSLAPWRDRSFVRHYDEIPFFPIKGRISIPIYQIFWRKVYGTAFKNIALLKIVAIDYSEPRIGRNACNRYTRDRTGIWRSLPEQVLHKLEQIFQSQMPSTFFGTPRPTYSKVTDIVPDGLSGLGPAIKSQSNSSSKEDETGAADHRREMKLGVRIKVSGRLSESLTT